MWNINGLTNRVIGDKTKNNDFLNHIKTYDFIFLTETWSKETINIPGFKATSSPVSPKSNRRGRLSGGITLLFKNEFQSQVSIEKTTKNSLWCKVSKNLLNLQNDLYLCGIYIPPEKTTYFDTEIFDNLKRNNLILCKR